MGSGYAARIREQVFRRDVRCLWDWKILLTSVPIAAVTPLVHWSIFSDTEEIKVELSWVLSGFLTFLAVASLMLVGMFLTAPWRLDKRQREAHESDLGGLGSKIAGLEESLLAKQEELDALLSFTTEGITWGEVTRTELQATLVGVKQPPCTSLTVSVSTDHNLQPVDLRITYSRPTDNHSASMKWMDHFTPGQPFTPSVALEALDSLRMETEDSGRTLLLKFSAPTLSTERQLRLTCRSYENDVQVLRVERRTTPQAPYTEESPTQPAE